MTSLATQLDRIYEKVAPTLPRELADKMQAELKQLATNELAKGLLAGAVATDFTLPDANGQLVTLSEYLAKGPVVLSFYRGSWCPFCTFELRAQMQVLPQIQALGATLMAISPEKQANSERLVQSNNIPFPVLTDVNGEVARAYKVAWEFSQELGELFLKYFRMDLTKINEQAGWMLPVPATFVIDRHGNIQLAFVEVDYSKRLEPSHIIEALQGL